MHITAPENLSVVGNGRLRKVENATTGFKTWTWAVTQPINNYNLIPYIGNYVSWKEIYKGEKGPLDCTYWVLKEDEAKAREQFKQVIPMMQCFENWFGPYPFYEDGYQLVQSPHLGMEHQSAVAYGNGFMNGYRGNDLSKSGWGLKWDFIIIHESGHEWFGNNITSKDIADMWIHESFTNYTETIYTGWQSGLEAGNDYVIGTRAGIRNDSPIIGIYGVNKEGSGDMYPKGGNMIHTIRTVINNDTLFKSIMRGMNADFYHKTIPADELFSYWSNRSGRDLSKIFDQYLRTVSIPELQYEWKNDGLYYRWANCIDGFDMPVRGELNGTEITLTPSDSWKKHSADLKEGELKINRNYYIQVKKV
jgi:aminopeptidase N